MEDSAQNRRPSILTTELDIGLLVEAITHVDEALSVDGSFQYLMAQWWNPDVHEDCVFGVYPNLKEKLQNSVQDSIGGSVFGRDGELKWRAFEGRLRIVVVASPDLSALGSSPSNGVIWRPETVEEQRCVAGTNGGFSEKFSTLLWGTDFNHDRKAWLESRIPRPLRYPVQPRQGSWNYVTVSGFQYRDAQGIVVASRLAGIDAEAVPSSKS